MSRVEVHIEMAAEAVDDQFNPFPSTIPRDVALPQVLLGTEFGDENGIRTVRADQLMRGMHDI